MKPNPKSKIRNPKSIWLVRHGESTANVARHEAEEKNLTMINFPEREADVALSEAGEKQAVELGLWFAEQVEKPTVIFSSTYLRTVETARLIEKNGKLKAEIILDERLREREFGIFDRLTKAGALAKYPEESARRELNGKFYHRPPGGESWCDVALRVRGFLADLRVNYADEKVLIVTHEAVIHLFRYVLENLTEEQILTIDRSDDVRNCAITSYEFERASCALKLENFSA